MTSKKKSPPLSKKKRVATKSDRGVSPPTPSRHSQRHSAYIPPISKTISVMGVKRTRYTPEEDDYIKANYGFLTLQQIADHLGRSTSGVDCRAKKLNLKNPITEIGCKISVIKGKTPLKKDTEQYPDGWMLEDLEEMRGVLKEALGDAPPNALPRIVGEYRETIKEIDEQLKQSSKEKEGSVLDDIRSSLKEGKSKAAN